MSTWELILHGAVRARLRFMLLSLAIATAIVMFVVVASFWSALNGPVRMAGTDRLVVTNRMSVTQPLPRSHVERITRMAGVRHVAAAIWFGGYFRDPRNEITIVAVDPDQWLEIHPEFMVLPDERAAFLADRTGLLVGARLAERTGWKTGDSVPLRSNFWTRNDGDDGWPVTVRAIFRGRDASVNTDRAFIQYEYLEQARGFWKGMIQQITVQTSSPAVNDEVASAIDRMTANSSWETVTSDESFVRRSMLRQFGDLNSILAIVMLTAFTSILMIVGNATLMGVRRRMQNFAIMRALGYARRQIAGHILLETAVVVSAGVAVGMSFSAVIVSLLQAPLRSIAPTFALTVPVALSAVAYAALLVGLIAAIPALVAARGGIVDGLRGS